MSFEIMLTRTFVPGIEKHLDPSAPPLTAGDFELIMDGAPLRKRLEDGTCWLWHPKNTAWLAASFKPGENAGEAYISFSVSYGHNQFLKIWADAFELALRLSRHLGTRVFEDCNYHEVSRENISELLAPESTFVREQAVFWKNTVSGLEERIQAPLEYPIDRYDAVNDYFIFFLEPKRQVDIPQMVSSLKLSCAPDSISNDRFALQDDSSGSVLSTVLLRANDGALQIRPFYWMEPFARVAAETLNLATTLQKELGGRLFLRDKPVDEALLAEIKENSKGLGVEFFLWLQAKDENRMQAR